GRDGGRGGLDRGDHEITVGDGRLDVLGALEVGPADGVAQLVAGQIDDQVFRDVIRADLDLDRVTDDFQRAALTEGFALVLVDEVDRNVDLDRLLGVDPHQVEVQRTVR